MHRMALLGSVALCLGGPTAPCAASPPQAADGNLPDPTVRFRTLEEIAVAVVAAAPPGGVVWCAVDADRALRADGLGVRWATALTDAADARAAGDAKAAPRLGLYAVEDAGAALRCPPTRDRDAFIDAFAAHCAQGDDRYRDAMTALRSIAQASRGPAHVLFLSHVNVEGEHDVEATLTALRQAQCTVSVVGRGAYLADSYWAVQPPTDGMPQDLQLAGPDAPTRELPSGWLFDDGGLDNVAPTGWGLYGFARLCAATGGRYWILAPGLERQTWCQAVACPFCDGTHQRCDEPFAESYLGLMAPWRGSRAAYARHVARHPLWVALVSAWEAAAKAGAVRTLPPKLLRGDPGAPGPARNPNFDDRFAAGSWRNRARDAAAMADTLAAALRSLQAARAKVARADAPRVWATAAVLEVQLAATAFSLRQFERFGHAVDGALGGRREPGEPAPPAKPAPNAVLDWHWVPRSFCHGTALLRETRWRGGEAAAAEFAALADLVDANAAAVAGTPYATQIRHTVVAVFGMAWAVPETPQPNPFPHGQLKNQPPAGTRTRGGRGTGGGSGRGGPTSGG
jgi:hypothetical protein